MEKKDLCTKIGINDEFICKIIDVIGLNDREKDILKKILFDQLTYDKVALKYDLTRERIRQIFEAAKRKLRHRIITSVIFYEPYIANKQKCTSIISDVIKINQITHKYMYNPNLNISIQSLDISIRLLNCLKSLNIQTLRDIDAHKYDNFLKYRMFGKKSLNELKELMKKYNIE